ncbi:hypothetical protein [Micromonospora globbae]|jgi:alkanesulfonate monooxygenase SsuD/methylene tetrahydromethanopterin reductase-like flavin-dependent oxidoreductase (luciferase family)|uniref:hypothetical protein n=1 Tax=Micromonospora globbae TaxID=1894969 RepID=UPI003414F78B
MLAIIGGRPQRFDDHVDLYHRALAQYGVVAALAEERGSYKPDRARFARELDQGALVVGSPETVAWKTAKMARDLRLSRFDLKYDITHLPRETRARTIELLGSEVAPRVRERLAKEPTHV